jgi:NAD(P)-dependent dehydrogenase (short-subunit alcohol dehydrogenase family)
LGFAEAGADVVAVSRRAAAVEKTAAEIRARQRRTLQVTADVTSRTELQRVIDLMVAEFARIDILVNSAGTTKRVPSLDMSLEDWNRILNTNLNGTWHACQLVGQVMKEQQYGRIINLASVTSFQGSYEAMAYCASKGAVLMLTRALAVEWAKYHITVNALAPGFFETPLNRAIFQDPVRKASILARTPMRRFGRVEEVQGAAIFLASDSASFVTGEVLSVDGGFLVQAIGAGQPTR